MDGPYGKAGEVVHVSGASCDAGVGEPDDDRVIGQVPEEGRSRAPHAEAAAEQSEGTQPPSNDGANTPRERESEERTDYPVWHLPCTKDTYQPWQAEALKGFALVC